MFGSTLVLTGSLMLSAPVYAATYQGTVNDYTWTLDDQTDCRFVKHIGQRTPREKANEEVS